MNAPVKPISWSPQQQAFIDWCEFGEGSCVLEAVAGAGKTTTLIGAVMRLKGSVAIVAYNKKIADEIKIKLEKAGIDWKKAQGGTVHSFGFSAFKKAFPNFNARTGVNANKVDDLFEKMIPDDHPHFKSQGNLVQLVSLAKQRALGVLGRAEDVNEWHDIIEHFGLFEEEMNGQLVDLIATAQSLLAASNKQLDVIDFDDMIYLPLFLKLRFWQYDVVMVDEAQDTNPARRALVRAMLKKGGRCIAVGDRHQAIYGFTGADSDALDLIAKDFNCQRLPLTVSYRCPRSVVDFAKQWVSHIEAHESAPQGEVSSTSMNEFLDQGKALDRNCAVLCRLTKPLISLAFTLIRKRIPCKVEGRDIAANLKKTMQRWKVTTLDALEKKLDDYLERETTKLLAKKQETKLQVVEDTVETIRTIIDQCRLEQKHSLKDAIEYVDSLFADNVSEMMVLSTIHKAKGREWPRVFWLDRANTCPSRWARQAWQQEQEVNLCYVAATRAQEQLIELYPALKDGTNENTEFATARVTTDQPA